MKICANYAVAMGNFFVVAPNAFISTIVSFIAVFFAKLRCISKEFDAVCDYMRFNWLITKMRSLFSSISDANHTIHNNQPKFYVNSL